jgi:hypothetical protein
MLDPHDGRVPQQVLVGSSLASMSLACTKIHYLGFDSQTVAFVYVDVVKYLSSKLFI